MANKTINGKQHMVRWHVDNVMALHVDPKVNNEFVKWTKSIYKKGEIGTVKYK